MEQTCEVATRIATIDRQAWGASSAAHARAREVDASVFGAMAAPRALVPVLRRGIRSDVEHLLLDPALVIERCTHMHRDNAVKEGIWRNLPRPPWKSQGEWSTANSLASDPNALQADFDSRESLALGAIARHFGWRNDEYHLLAGGCLAVRLLSPAWVVNCDREAGIILTPTESGVGVGIIEVGGQMMRGLADPGCHVLPHVCCDFTGVTLAYQEGGRVCVRGARGGPPHQAAAQRPQRFFFGSRVPGSSRRVPLSEVAVTRAGLTCAMVNVAVLACQPRYVSSIARSLTEARVSERLGRCVSGVSRYDLPGVHAFNFVFQRFQAGDRESIQDALSAEQLSEILMNLEIECD